jgi:putative transposase
MAYLDLNPVRAGLVGQAADYEWSSHEHYAGQKVDKLITPHPLVWGLGNTPFAREAAYADLVRGGVSASKTVQLTDAALRGWALGDANFVKRLQDLTPRRVSKTAAGRPLKVEKVLK